MRFFYTLSAGLEGIEKEYDIVEPVKTNVYKMSGEERKEKGIGQLPENLWQAIKVAEESIWLKKTLGEPLFFKLIENKRIEWENYRSRVTSYELEQYLPIL